MRLLLNVFTFVTFSFFMSACDRWAPGYIITEDGTMLSNSDVNQRDVTVQTIRSQLDKQLGEHWRVQVDLPELPIYESDDRNVSLSWTWKKASLTVTLVSDGLVPLTISEKEIHDEIMDFMYQKVYQPKKNLTIVIVKKVDATLLATLINPSSKPDVSQLRHYTVQTNDTWADISQAFYGTTQHWRLLSDANQGGDLTVGRVLLIPVKP
jgi:LysM domain